MSSAPPPEFSFEPLVPLPKQDEEPNIDLRQLNGEPSSPFSSLFAPPSSQTAASLSPSTKPLFPNSSIDTRPGRKTSSASASISHQALESPSDAFGDFVEFDPLQSSQTAFSPLPSPTHTRTHPPKPNAPSDSRDTHDLSSPQQPKPGHGAFDGNHFVQEATARTQERSERVLKGLADANQDDPLGWLSESTSELKVEDQTPFDDWDGMGEDAEEEIAYHTEAPHTPRASPIPMDGDMLSMERAHESDDEILDLKTGKREKYTRKVESDHQGETKKAATPISIAPSNNRRNHQPHEVSSSKLTTSTPTSSSYFNSFTLPRTWFSSTSASPPVVQTSSVPRSGLTRQNSVGEFSELPAADLKIFESSSPTVKTHSPRFSLAGVFDHPATILEAEVVPSSPSNPMSKKFFVPPTGAPGKPCFGEPA